MSKSKGTRKRMTIRLPGNLARQLEKLAKEKGVSLNEYLVEWLESLHS